MKFGDISCECGYNFYFETEMESVRCLKCGERFDTTAYPNKEDVNTKVSETGTGKVADWDIDEGVLL